MSVKAWQDKKGKWWVTIQWTVAHGRRFRKSKLIGDGTAAKEAAEDRARKLNEIWMRYGVDAIRLVEDPAAPEKRKEIPTVREYMEIFLNRMNASGLKQTTMRMYRQNLEDHISPEMGDVRLDEVSYATAANFLASKSAMTYSPARFRRGKSSKPMPKPRGYSRDSIRVMCMSLRALMSEAVRDGLVKSNPIVGLSRYYRKKKKDREVSRHDVYALDELHSIEAEVKGRNPEYYEFVLAMSREGMRIGEAAALEVPDIDLERGIVKIDKNIPMSSGELSDSAKTESSNRTIEIWSTDFVDAVRKMIIRRKKEAFAQGEEPATRLFCEGSGHVIDYSRFHRAWMGAQRRAGVKPRPPHTLRHTWASQMISSGEDIAAVSKHLGHANPGVTLSIYTHFLPGRTRTRGTVLDRASDKYVTSGKAKTK